MLRKIYNRNYYTRYFSKNDLKKNYKNIFNLKTYKRISKNVCNK